MAFFTDTNGGNDTTPANPASKNYAPLQQLLSDLSTNSVSRYNWITPDQYNDMHTALAGGFTDPRTNIHYDNDAARIAQGDYFLSQIIPDIMASQAYQNNGAIVLWWDEIGGRNRRKPDDLTHTIAEIVISPLAHPNVNGLPFDSLSYYTHSSDLRTLQDIFQVSGIRCRRRLRSISAMRPMPTRWLTCSRPASFPIVYRNQARCSCWHPACWAWGSFAGASDWGEWPIVRVRPVIARSAATRQSPSMGIASLA